jgi:hypothetical protein
VANGGISKKVNENINIKKEEYEKIPQGLDS